MPEGSGIVAAIDYTLKRWVPLGRFLDDGNVSCHNNHLKNLMRPWAMGRKAWLFAGSELAGKRAATVMSLAQSARMHGHDPWLYLRDVLFSLLTHPALDIDAFWSRRSRCACASLASAREVPRGGCPPPGLRRSATAGPAAVAGGTAWPGRLRRAAGRRRLLCSVMFFGGDPHEHVFTPDRLARRIARDAARALFSAQTSFESGRMADSNLLQLSSGTEPAIKQGRHMPTPPVTPRGSLSALPANPSVDASASSSGSSSGSSSSSSDASTSNALVVIYLWKESMNLPQGHAAMKIEERCVFRRT